MEPSSASREISVEQALRLLEQFRALITESQEPPSQPSLAQELLPYEQAAHALLQVRRLLFALAQGDLSYEVREKGALAGALKSLQANLRHLTWQTQQVARGDFTQRVEFMGDFSEAFNTMVTQLDAMARELQIQRDELMRRNESLILEIAERQRAEAAERKQRELAEALQRAAMALNATLNYEEVLDIMLERVNEVVGYDSAMIMEVEGMSARVRRAKNYHRYGEEVEKKVLSACFDIPSTPNLFAMFTSLRPLVIPDVDRYPARRRSQIVSPARSWIGAPIYAHGDVLAFFSLDKLEAGYYQEEHARTLERFASQAALAMVNARLFREIQRLAITDTLTGLYNRRYFLERAYQEFARSCRYRHPLTIVILDLDHFKSINDTYGHPIGDLVLQTAARLVNQTVRRSDLAARFGGEEMILLLPETPPQAGVVLAERLRERIATTPIAANEHILSITASFGVCGAETADCHMEPRRAVETLIELADRALYQAKQAGRNRVCSIQFSFTAPPLA
ncbi:MAG: diguanylate cyclase [Anaerolineales bacterium]|nr:diguanylate cyclase [Anaerolineales bacterium]MCS7248212.1 diguanylate cyclase [Anaerolineales bacterium]MDW8162025.1 diguanylate cyclase [Anaerolineales bacterium]MDW8445901.1 diguanylate cyclase [Anaerolineales bacterium]